MITLLTGWTATFALGRELDSSFYAISLSLGGLILLAVLVGQAQYRDHTGFGCANSVTLARGLLICPLAGAPAGLLWDAPLAWLLFGLALMAFLLDGVDGWIARKRQECSRFGARFDMETDALFLLVLSLMVYGAGKAGPWILVAGLLRYLFVAACLLWPPLQRPLPPSVRRKAICALQVGALVLCLAPIVPLDLSLWLAGIGLTALIASFLCDLRWLIGQAMDQAEAPWMAARLSGAMPRAMEGRALTMPRASRWRELRQRTIWIALVLSAMTTVAAPRALAAPAQYKIDPEHFSVGFLVHHIGYADTLGMFLEGAGSFTFDEGAPAVSDIEVTIKADSVFTNHDRRDKHVKGSDFLDVEDHPEIRFVGREARPTGDTTGEVTGDLTLLGVTKPVTLQVTLNKAGEYPFGAGPPYVVGVSVRATVKRSDFGMTYAVENGWVGDEVELIIEFEAIRQD